MSTFMAFPGNPIYATRDLTTWTLASHGINRAAQQFPRAPHGHGSTESPHFYRKDGWYYLLVAEGGTQLNHSANLARSRTLAPNATWKPCPNNPLVSSSGTDAYFQTVGHADPFQDGAGNWWGIALSTHGGLELYNDLIFPMGRETVLYLVSWREWPVAEQVRGSMTGPLPASAEAVIEGSGPVVGEADAVDFALGTSIPIGSNYWRAPFDANTSAIFDENDHANTLRITASRANLTADAAFNASIEGLSAVFRGQEHSYLNFSVDLHLPTDSADRVEGDELGVSNFLNQDQYVDIGIVYLPPQQKSNITGSRKTTSLQPYFRVRAHSVRYAPVPKLIITPVPSARLKSDEDAVVRLRISPRNDSYYEVFASQDGDDGAEATSLAVYTTALLSGDGAGTGGLLGVYATTNGGNQTFGAYFGRWRYESVAQVIDYGVIVPVNGKAPA
ncbi:non-reducing end alpha-L-arabinofuranosidase BoGH43A [Apiospora phragmitis]|uniref:Non-reducing end alpha-L-arabinofuranosidase BoGH43A n=1 Tax=Apiospora phragmitis TaxID=2905665 RepID=A0ABR1VT45_9PEZI